MHGPRSVLKQCTATSSLSNVEPSNIAYIVQHQHGKKIIHYLKKNMSFVFEHN